MGENTRNDTFTVAANAFTSVEDRMNTNEGRRVEFFLRNNSTGGQLITVFLSDFQTATSGSGIILAAGQAITQSEDAGYRPWQGKITAIADNANASLSYYARTVV
jgi:hypothetical protein